MLAHALMKVGAVLLPLSPRLTEAERAAIVAAEEPAVDLDDPGQLTQTEADLPLLGEHDMDDVCARVLTSGSSGAPKPVGLTYGNFLWSAIGSGLQHRRRPRRPLALLRAAQPHRRPRDRHALGRSTGPPRSSTTASTSTASPPRCEEDGITIVSLVATMLTAAARRRRRPLRPAGDPGRRRPGPRRAARRRRSPRRHRGPDLRPDRDLLAGDDAGPGRRAPQARLGRAAAADHPPADPRRRDPRPGPDRRPRPRRRRRLAAHRRPRPHRRGGLPLRQGPDRRPDRHRRRERGPGRGRGGAAAPPRRSPTPR